MDQNFAYGENELASDWLKRIGATGVQPQPATQQPQSPAAGLFDFGAGLYSRNAGANEAAQRLATAQGPNYNAAQAGVGANLALAGNMDPNAFAAQRFAQQQALVNPVQQKQLDDLQRRMYAQGNMGAATYNPGIPGVTPNGTPMNPQLAALYAGQSSANAQAAYDSLNQGTNQLNAILSRAGLLQDVAGRTQATGLQGQMTQPSRAAGNSQLISGIGGILKQPGVMSKVSGMLGNGASWLFGNQDPLKTFDYSYDPSEGAAGDFNF